MSQLGGEEPRARPYQPHGGATLASARKLLVKATIRVMRAETVAVMRCAGNAQGLCAELEYAGLLQVVDQAIAELHQARAHMVLDRAMLPACGGCLRVAGEQLEAQRAGIGDGVPSCEELRSR